MFKNILRCGGCGGNSYTKVYKLPLLNLWFYYFKCGWCGLVELGRAYVMKVGS